MSRRLILVVCLRPRLARLAVVPESITQIGELIAEICRLLVERGRALPGLSGALSGSLRFARRVPGPCLGFVAEPFEQPDALDQSFTRYRIHDSTTCRFRGVGVA